MRPIETTHWRRIHKKVAIRLHESGRNIYVLPSNVNPESMWISPAQMTPERDWEKWMNEYYYYLGSQFPSQSCSYFVNKEEQMQFNEWVDHRKTKNTL